MSSKREKNVGEFIGTAFVSYLATNIDDLVILMNFFTEASLSNSSLKIQHIFLGQYLGFLLLLGISLIGYGISYALPVEMLGFLGFIPIVLGLKSLIEIIRELYKKSDENLDDILPNDDISTIELETIRYRRDTNEEISSEIINQSSEFPSIVNPSSRKSHWKKQLLNIFSFCFNIQTLKIASITIANSGDNVAIYTPLFAQASTWQIVVYMAIFLVMVFVWLMFSYLFINFRPILSIAQEYAEYLVPIVFIGIGIYIIITSDCFPWLDRAIRTKNFQNG
ncbi:unnamed protein product [Adineta ricciae]|uniref:Cadmium resistance transporter n=1 Tax=Adineta ricciae TaxID=249248 RepID=A0A813XFM0_ADIRI|nr:unnamed protein product [Adineta ricciae]CAF1215821.1 unnamed protein product [Adineta ricciae]